ncbi:MAG: TonB-dependent receptor [Akkermansia sp.]|nr:TonB-dependent receptor [Akkermansia sp.]
MKQNTFAPQGGARYVVLAMAMASGCAYAQAEAIVETELPPVVSSAHDGVEIPYDKTGVSVTILDAQKEREAGRYTLTEALSQVPGVSILPGGGDNQRGNVSNIAIRGMSSGTSTLPMIDGMRIFNSSGCSNLTPNVMARTNMFDVKQVEILRGAEGATYGGGAMGGVIYMETPEGQGSPQVSLFNEAGSHDSYTGNITAQGKISDTAFFLSSTYDRTNNDLQYTDGSHPTAHNAGKYENYSQALRLDHYLSADTKLTLTYRREDADYNYYSPDPYYGGVMPYTFRSNLVTAKGQSKLTDKWTSSLMAGYFGNDYMLGAGYYCETRNVQIEWRNAYKWCEHHTTTAGFSWLRSQYDGTNNGDRTPDSGLENTYSLFAEHLYSPVEQWNNSIAVRLDQSSVFDALWSTRAASSYRFNQDNSRVYGSIGTGYRAPGALQRSEASITCFGSTYHGNPELECEHSTSFDLGFEQQWSKGHYVSATYFWERVEDAINNIWVYDPNTWASDAYFYNSPHWTIQGVELAARGDWNDTWKSGYKISATFTQPKQEQNQQIKYSSRQTWAADVHTSPIEGLTTGLGLTAAVGRTLNSSSRVDNYYTLRWYAHYKVNENVSLHLRVENLTNQKYVIEPGYNGGFYMVPDMVNSGTSIHAGCTVTF